MANNKHIQEAFNFNDVKLNDTMRSVMTDNLIKYNLQRNNDFLHSFKTDIDALYFILKQYIKISKKDVQAYHRKWNKANNLIGWYNDTMDALIEKLDVVKTIDSWETVTDIDPYKTLLSRYADIAVHRLQVDKLTIKISPDHGLIIACNIVDNKKYIFCYFIILTGEYDYTDTKLMTEKFDFNKMISLS